MNRIRPKRPRLRLDPELYDQLRKHVLRRERWGVPDRRGQQAVVLLFGRFLELGTRSSNPDGVLGTRTRTSRAHWRKARPVGNAPSYATVYRLLTNPVYGGAYGKTEPTLDYENGEPRRGWRRKPREQWLTLIPNSHERYVSWDQFGQIPTNDRG